MFSYVYSLLLHSRVPQIECPHNETICPIRIKSCFKRFLTWCWLHWEAHLQSNVMPGLRADPINELLIRTQSPNNWHWALWYHIGINAWFSLLNPTACLSALNFLYVPGERSMFPQQWAVTGSWQSPTHRAACLWEQPMSSWSYWHSRGFHLTSNPPTSNPQALYTDWCQMHLCTHLLLAIGIAEFLHAIISPHSSSLAILAFNVRQWQV